jgi:hypothetical protein
LSACVKVHLHRLYDGIVFGRVLIHSHVCIVGRFCDRDVRPKVEKDCRSRTSSYDRILDSSACDRGGDKVEIRGFGSFCTYGTFRLDMNMRLPIEPERQGPGHETRQLSFYYEEQAAVKGCWGATERNGELSIMFLVLTRFAGVLRAATFVEHHR